MAPRLRQLVISIHVILAGFFLPMAVMFAVTGGLYTFGVKGDYDTLKESLALALSDEPSLNELISHSENYLREKGVAHNPTGSPSIRKVGTSWQFEWSGSQYDFSLEPTGGKGLYNVAIKKTNWHRFFVQLHKAKGGWPFKVLAGALAVALLALFASGVLLAFATPKLKRSLYVSLLLGALAFITLAWMS